MGFRFTLARAASAASTFGLKNIFRRPAANFPGKLALYIDPQLLTHLRERLNDGSIMIVGTNGKTTVTNLLADVLERAGKTVVCNRTGANLDSGVSTALLHARAADWGVFESDELWLAKMTPQLKPRYVLLLNLFRDQLDRCGEIDRIQDSIVAALETSPDTVLIYNADDPLCATIAARAAQCPDRKGVPSIAFGVAHDMGLEQNTVADATMCQRCSSMFEYAFRQYGQLGNWRCPNCGFSRPVLNFAADDVAFGAHELSFTVQPASLRLHAPLSGAYMVYNLLSVATVVGLLNIPHEAMQCAINAFDPQNGRLQNYCIGERSVLLNLAKNPTGFNQNLKIVSRDTAAKIVAFFINDKEADGHDVSWLWDIDFEELANQDGTCVFAGGVRSYDMQVRLKYAGISAEVAKSAEDLLARIAKFPDEQNAYIIANYTALPQVKATLDSVSADRGKTAQALEARGETQAPEARGETVVAHESLPAEELASAKESESAKESSESAGGSSESAKESNTSTTPLVIAHLFPDLLNLYGDGGNVRILAKRLEWRDIPVRVERVCYGQTLDFSCVDLVFLGGGPDREQKLASSELMRMKDELKSFVETDGVLLAICGGYQVLGSVWLLGDEEVPGLGIVDFATRRPGTSADRLIDNIALHSMLATQPVVGYENHAGRTYLGAGVKAFGSVVSNSGHGNNDVDKTDGVVYRNVVGTYLHGPLLAKNPEVADWLLARALERWGARTQQCPRALFALNDTQEFLANAAMAKRIGARERM